MRNKIITCVAALLTLLVVSCREDSDFFNDYGQGQRLSFGRATQSYAEEFKVFWNGMNQQYTLWDLEAKNGLDWDAVYDEFLPQFEALDEKKEKEEEVTDDELEELLTKLVSPLHDGHMSVTFKNLATGNNVSVSPSDLRNKSRDDYKAASAFSPDLTAYANLKNPNESEIVSTDSIHEYASVSTFPTTYLSEFFTKEDYGMDYIKGKIGELSEMEFPDAEEVILLKQYMSLAQEVSNIQEANSESIRQFNFLVEKYAALKVPGLEEINTDFIEDGITVKYALFKGNIAYFYLSDFALSYYTDPDMTESTFGETKGRAKEDIEKVKEVWEMWFEKIYELKKKGELGGVIIDVRTNGGGLSSDFSYVMGALLPSGSQLEIGKERFKAGVGRYDYSPLLPDVKSALDKGQEGVTEPIVVLANCCSVSMSEITSLSAKALPNAKVIGKRTWGGLCGLVGNNDFTRTYAGYIGEKGVTPVYVYLPCLSQFSLDGELLEGYGVTPDIEVDLDADQFKTTGFDSQLDRALKYIRTGN